MLLRLVALGDWAAQRTVLGLSWMWHDGAETAEAEAVEAVMLVPVYDLGHVLWSTGIIHV
eukprot:SAG11_NODE_16316_length_551_cov_0.451327_1_plen_59_part_01